MKAIANQKVWVSYAEAQRRAEIGRAALSSLIARGLLSVRSIPGSKPRVRLDELQKVVDSSTRRAVAEGVSSA